MQTVLAWLGDEPHGWRLVRFIGMMVMITLGYFIAALALLGWLLPVSSMMGGGSIGVLFFLAGFEEVLFRIPLVFPLMFQRNWLTFLSVLILATFFGYIHGGLINIPFQGVSGLLLSATFLRCGGWRWGRELDPLAAFKGLACSTLHHGCYNLLITYLSLFWNGYFS